jgi:hypothetical protein
LQHGYAHRNHAPAGERNWELGDHRPVEAVVAELETGRTELGRRFGPRFVPVLVPPWNRIDARVVMRLSVAGYRGLSTFGPRDVAEPALTSCAVQYARRCHRVGTRAGVHWHRCGNRSRRRAPSGAPGRRVDPAEPTGLLTHHLDLQDEAWQFLAELIARSKAHGAATWIGAGTAFRPVTSARSA